MVGKSYPYLLQQKEDEKRTSGKEEISIILSHNYLM